MGYLSDEVAADALEEVVKKPEVQASIQTWQLAWDGAALPPQEIGLNFLGPTFAPDPPEALLPEDRRQRAVNPDLWQLVLMTDSGLDVRTFDLEDEALNALAALGPGEYGEGGVIVIKGETPVKENLFLKYMQKIDYIEYLQRARLPPKNEQQDAKAVNMVAVEQTLTERLESLTRLAPTLGKLKTKYESKGLTEPEVIYGRPSDALIEFAHIFPQYIQLGGCAAPPTPPPEPEQ